MNLHFRSISVFVILTLNKLLAIQGRLNESSQTRGSESSENNLNEAISYLLNNDVTPAVLFVMDPNSGMCTEDVAIDAFTNRTLLSWVYNLNDALTLSKTVPNGVPLQVCGVESIRKR